MGRNVKPSTELTAAIRKKEVVRLRLENLEQQEIADMLGITQGRVSQILTELRNRWKDESMADVAALVAESVENLRVVRGEAAKRMDGALDGARYMDVVIKAEDRLIKLLGLDPANKLDVTSGGKPIKGYMGLTPDDWDEEAPTE